MKLFVNREVVNGPYGGGNMFLKALFDLAPANKVSIGTRLNQRYDAVLLMDPRPDDTTGLGIADVQRYKLFQSHVKVFQRVNECDARKQTTGVDAMLHAAGQQNDFTFFVSDWMRDYHVKRGWPCQKSEVIYNGVDRTIFRPRVAKTLDSDKIHIVTHHWSDNVYKGSDVHKWLDQFVAANPQFTYTYIGRTQDTLPNTKIIEPLFGKSLGDELQKYDVYVTGTVCDPGPNHCIEAIACGIPTYAHSRGGGAVEFVGASHTYDTVEKLTEFLTAIERQKNSWVPPTWEECVSRYFKKMKEVVNG